MPIIGNNVSIGNGAIVVGPITVGDNVVIGANSYMDKDVKSGTKIIGPTSRIIELKKLI